MKKIFVLLTCVSLTCVLLVFLQFNSMVFAHEDGHQFSNLQLNSDCDGFTVTGDFAADWFYHNGVLELLNNIYQDENYYKFIYSAGEVIIM